MRSRACAAYSLAALRILLYPLLGAVFLVLLRVNNPYFLQINRTTAITGLTLLVTLVAFSRIYGGFQIGEIRSKGVFSNMCAAVLLSDVVSYLSLEIMNVNDRNRQRLELFGRDFVLLLFAMLLQIALIGLLVWLCSRLYDRVNPPMKCCVITGDTASREMMLPKLKAWEERFAITETVLADDPGVRDAIKRNESVVLFHVSPVDHQQLIEYCYKHRKAIYFDMRMGDIIAHDARPMFLDDVLMGVHTRHGLTLKQRAIKRSLDVAISLVLITLTLPVMAVCAVMILLDDGRPVVYKQDRITRGDRVFTIFKFRTMRTEVCAADHSVTGDDPRITRIGRKLRRYRLDELPQLFNILRGDMSLVGPRPEMLANVEEYTRELPEFQYRSKVKAGLTGYAQIMGKYNTPPREKLMMDVSYIDNYSLWLDVKLMFRTVVAVFRPDATEAFQKEVRESQDDNDDAI